MRKEDPAFMFEDKLREREIAGLLSFFPFWHQMQIESERERRERSSCLYTYTRRHFEEIENDKFIMSQGSIFIFPYVIF